MERQSRRDQTVGLGHLRVDVGVVDDEQVPVRGDGCDERTLGIPGRGPQQRRVLGRDQIESSGRNRRLEEPGEQPVHLDARLACCAGSVRSRDLRDVDRRDFPTLLSEPDCVRPLTTADVKGCAPAREQRPPPQGSRWAPRVPTSAPPPSIAHPSRHRRGGRPRGGVRRRRGAGGVGNGPVGVHRRGRRFGPSFIVTRVCTIGDAPTSRARAARARGRHPGTSPGDGMACLSRLPRGASGRHRWLFHPRGRSGHAGSLVPGVPRARC